MKKQQRKCKGVRQKLALLCLCGMFTFHSLSAQAMPGTDAIENESIAVERIDDLDSSVSLPESSDDLQQNDSEENAEENVESQFNSESSGEVLIEQNPLSEKETSDEETSGNEETFGDSESESPFSVDGDATILDDIHSGTKHFYTIVTDDGNTFYLVIDEAKEDSNVYLLDAAKEKDLVALAKEAGQLSEPETTSTMTETESAPEESTENLEEKVERESNTNWGSLLFLLVISLAAFGIGYYVKIYRPRMEKMEAELEKESEEKVDAVIDEEEEIYINEEEEANKAKKANQNTFVFEDEEHSFTEN